MAKVKGRRDHGQGSIEERDGIFRLRYRVNGKRYSKTLETGTTLTAARNALRNVLSKADDGEHVPPSRMTLNMWFDQWLAIGAPGRGKRAVSERTKERYTQLLGEHVRPVLGERPLQQLQPTEIDQLFAGLKTKLSPRTKRVLAPRTQRHVAVVFGASMATAKRKKLINVNPMDHIESAPSGGESDHGQVLDEMQLAVVVAGFRDSAIFALVQLAAATGMRRNELLALRWTDFDPTAKVIKVERALEVTKLGVRIKPPKTARGKRDISLDDGTVAMLQRERERYQRIKVGVGDADAVDLSLVKLPADSLMFPALPKAGEPFTFNRTREPHDVTKLFRRRVKKMGFPKLRFHNLRHTHATILADRGVPLHVIAKRIGDDPAVVMKNYMKAHDDKAAAVTFGSITAGFVVP